MSEAKRISVNAGMLVLLVFVTFCFVVLALKIQTNVSEIKRAQQSIAIVQAQRQATIAHQTQINYRSCLDVRDFHAKFSELIQAAIKQTSAQPVGPALSAKMKAANLKTLTDLLDHIKVPDCGPAPR